jgi:phenylacetate-CoA ligase
MIPLLTYRFNLMATRLRKLKLNCKIAAFTAMKRRISLKVKKRNCCIPFKQPFYQQLVGTKSVNNWNDLPVLTKKILATLN